MENVRIRRSFNLKTPSIHQVTNAIVEKERIQLRHIAMKIDKIPIKFSYDGKSINMKKVQKVLREYK